LTLSLISQIPNNPLLVLLNPKPDSIVQKAILFKEKGILKYKKIDIASWIYGKLATPDGIGAGTYRIERTKKGEISISGWAVIPKKSRPADFVIITRMNELGNASLYTALSVGLKRPDAVQSLQEKAVLSSGFYVSIKTEKDFEKYQYGVFAVDQRNHLLYSLHSDDS
jgi:hypothetical protein